MSPALRAAIALALMIGFYVLAIGSGVGLLVLAWYAVTSHSAAGLKLAFFSAAAGGTVLLSLRPRIDRFEPPGPRLTRESQPALFGVIDDVARATNQAMPAEVYAIDSVNAWVSTRGGILGIGGRRVMGLGIPLLHLLTVDQLKAVLAHEFGHYGGGDTKVGRLVYHTRLGLGRTLQAVDGKAIAALFNFYGRLVMRISTAVARQQEFAADQFAARTTSGKDLADSLQKLDRHGSLFLLYYVSNIQPVVEEGYWVPIGSGFAEFCGSPMFEHAKLAAVGSDNAIASGETAEEDDGAFESHPPTAARVAALEALATGPARMADVRIAGTLLREPESLESSLYQPKDREPASLTFVEWPEVTPRVMVPRWKRIARERSHILVHVRIERPPVSLKDAIQLGRTEGGLRMRIKDDPDVAQFVLFGIACGVMSRLIEHGWTPAPCPSLVAELIRGDERIDPMQRVYAIASGDLPIAEWAAFCEKEGLSGPLVN